MAGPAILSIMLMVPALGSIALLFLPKAQLKAIRAIALFLSFVPLALSLLVFLPASLGLLLPRYTMAAAGYQLTENVPWITEYGINYRLGVDGIAMPLVVLTTLIMPAAVGISWDVKHRASEYFALLLMMEVGMLGVFFAMDYFLFYIFWEIVLIPMYFLIGIWGGPRKEYAAIKFFIYTHVASVIMLLGFMAMYFQAWTSLGHPTFAMQDIASVAGGWDIGLKGLIFLLLFIGFAVKLPSVPFHTWLPDAHVEAPTAGSVILAAVLIKLGGYGLIRVNLMTFPDVLSQAYAVGRIALPRTDLVLAFIGVVSIIYGAFICLAQKDLKRMIAYSSVSHMGLVLYGIASGTAVGISGAVLQMFAHGLISGTLFMMAGTIHHHVGTRQIPRIGGLAAAMPKAGLVLMVACLASLGLPGLASFLSEYMVFAGGHASFGLAASPVSIAIPVLGILITAGYYIWAMQRILFGPLRLPDTREAKHLHDLMGWEKAVLFPMIVLIVFFGIWPAAVLDFTNPVSAVIAAAIHGGG